jgi:acyl dehydratase
MIRSIVRPSLRMVGVHARLLSTEGEFAIQSTLFSGNEKSLTVGETATVKHVFRQEIVNQFATICGDNNPLHTNPEFAKTTMFGGTIVHGIFVTSLFSTLFGRSINGAIYVSQSVNFKRPVYVGKEVVATITVKSVEPKKKGDLVTCSTVCSLADGTVAIDGEAKVLLPPGAFKAI